MLRGMELLLDVLGEDGGGLKEKGWRWIDVTYSLRSNGMRVLIRLVSAVLAFV